MGNVKAWANSPEVRLPIAATDILIWKQKLSKQTNMNRQQMNGYVHAFQPGDVKLSPVRCNLVFVALSLP
jgi:hypothetical protein